MGQRLLPCADIVSLGGGADLPDTLVRDYLMDISGFAHKRRLISLMMLVLGLSFASPPLLAMRCGTELISEGDLALELRKHCGEPDWIDRQYEEIVYDEEGDFEHRIANVIERWVYNFGPNQFMRFVLIRNNRVAQITTGDYGFTMPKSPPRCDSRVFSLGMSLLEVQGKCGKPDSVSQRHETITRPLAKGVRGKSTVTIDEWIYNLGPQRFVRILVFRNGRLTKVETGGKGF